MCDATHVHSLAPPGPRCVGSLCRRSRASPSTTEPALAFPTEVFAGISEDPVSDEVAAEFQAILDEMASDGGLAAIHRGRSPSDLRVQAVNRLGY